MTARNWKIPRRTFLRGMGVTLSLPLLNAMGKVLPSASAEAVASSSAAKSVQAPVRMACLYFPNGVWEKTWFPATGGEDYEMPFALEPLANHRKEMLIFSNFDRRHSHNGDGHYAKTANFLTGQPVRKTAGKESVSVAFLLINYVHSSLDTSLPCLHSNWELILSSLASIQTSDSPAYTAPTFRGVRPALL